MVPHRTSPLVFENLCLDICVLTELHCMCKCMDVLHTYNRQFQGCYDGY